MARAVNTPGPACLCAMGMNQLVEKNLSPPRAPLCCSSRTKTVEWNIRLHAPACIIHMGVGVELGCASVPEEACRVISWVNVSGRMFMAVLFSMAMPGI